MVDISPIWKSEIKGRQKDASGEFLNNMEVTYPKCRRNNNNIIFTLYKTNKQKVSSTIQGKF